MEVKQEQGEGVKKEEQSPEVKELLLDQSLESLANNPKLTPQLGDAIGMTTDYDARNKAAEENIRKTYFKNDPKGFKRWNTRPEKIKNDIETRASIARYEESQTRQYYKVQHELNEQAEDTQHKSSLLMGENAILSELAEKRSTIQKTYESNYDVENKKWENQKTFINSMKPTDDSDAAKKLNEEEKKKRLEAAALEARTAFDKVQKTKDDALKAAQADFDTKSKEYSEKLKEHYIKAVQRRTQFQMSTGLDSKSAFYAAISTVGKDAKTMLQNLIDAGQGAFVQNILNEISSPEATFNKAPRKDAAGNVVLDKNGKEIIDYEYDPRLVMCMDNTQIADVQKYLNEKIKAEISKSNIETNQRNKQLQLVASDIVYQANELIKQPEFDIQKMQELYARAEELKKANYPQAHTVLKNLNTVLFKADRNAKANAAAQVRWQKLAEKAAAKQIASEAETEIEKEVVRLSNLNGRKYKQEIVDEQGRKAVVELDANRGICMVIDEGRMLGLCKGKVWDAIYKRYSKATENRDIIEDVINRLFKTEQTPRILIDYGDGGKLRTNNIRKGNITQNTYIKNQAVIRPQKNSGFRDRTMEPQFLDRVIELSQEFLDKDVVAADEKGLYEFLSTNYDKIYLDTAGEDFGKNFMLDLQSRLNARYTSSPEVVMWDKNGSRRLQTVQQGQVGYPSMDTIRTQLPIFKKMDIEKVKQAIMTGNNIDEKKELEELHSIMGLQFSASESEEAPYEVLDADEFAIDNF